MKDTPASICFPATPISRVKYTLIVYIDGAPFCHFVHTDEERDKLIQHLQRVGMVPIISPGRSEAKTTTKEVTVKEIAWSTH